MGWCPNKCVATLEPHTGIQYKYPNHIKYYCRYYTKEPVDCRRMRCVRLQATQFDCQKLTWTNGQKDRETERQMDIRTDRQKDI